MNNSWPTEESTSDSSVGPQEEYSLCLECSSSRSIHGSALEANRESARNTDTAGAFLEGRGRKFVYMFTSEPFMNTFRPSVMGLYTDTQRRITKQM
jgi:hypothetical protein